MRPGFRLAAALRRLIKDRRGIAMTEFAIVLPVLLTAGLYGAEIARLAIVKMRVSQIALSVADNAARIGQTDNSIVVPTVSETDIDALLGGALEQGKPIDLAGQGEVILSSLERDPETGRQYIHWQRCRGALSATSAYGDDDPDHRTSGPELVGMGSGRQKATAQDGEAVMFVEIAYHYKPMLTAPFSSGEATLREEAAFIVRDDRNLSKGLTGDESKSTCPGRPDAPLTT